MSFAGKPLEGKRVVITRGYQQAQPFAALLRDEGAEPVLCPMLELAPPADPAALPQALRDLFSFDMLIVTSANGANAIANALNENRIEPPPKNSIQVLAVGPQTALALFDIGLRAEVPNVEFSAEKLFEAIIGRVHGKRILVIQSQDADDLLVSSLRRVGADVTAVDGYRSRLPLDADKNVQALFTPEFNAQVVTFFSGRTAANFFAVLSRNVLDMPAGVLTVSIGPKTTQEMSAMGKPPRLQAAETTAEALTSAIVDWYRQRN